MPRFTSRSLVPLAILVSPFVLLLLHVVKPGAAPPRPESIADHASGNPSAWAALSLKALDPVYDGANGRDSDADLMGFHADQTEAGLDLRIDLARPGFPRVAREALDRGDAAVYVFIDYMDGGSHALPDGLRSDGTEGREVEVGGALPAGLSITGTDIAWDRAVRFQRGADGRLAGRFVGVDATGKPSPRAADLEPGEAVASAAFSPRWDMCEAVIGLGADYRAAVTAAAGVPSVAFGLVAPKAAREEATPIRYLVVSAVDGRVEDTIEATNEAQSPAGAHNVVFVQHGNQGLTYTTVFRGERGENATYDGDPNNPDDGFDELLAAHDYYDVPGNFHMAATLQTAAEWHDPTFNDYLVTGVTQGWAQMVTSAWAQHIMPFFQYNMNSWSVDRETDMTNFRYGGTATVAWVPERVWLDNPDNDGNGTAANNGVIDWIGTSFLANGVQAVILDDYIHCGYKNNAFDDHHIYTLGNGLKVIPIDNNFVGEVNYDYGNAWNRIINSSADELIVYGNDWEFCAEVSQGAGNAAALNNYIEILRRCNMNSATVSVWKVNDTLGGFGGGAISLQNGTYGLLGGYGGYGGGNNSWYTSWAGYTGANNQDGHLPKWNYGQIWNNAYTKLTGVPVNNISEGAWYVMMTNLHESGWHDNGEVSGWQHHYTNHIKNANAHSEAARWAGGLYGASTGAYLADFDDDGIQEAVIYNDRLLAVFESIGGKLQWLFAKGVDYNYSVVSNDNVYWADTDGDYNEVNHIAGLSDVSVAGIDREHELYGLSVVTGAGSTVELKLTHAAVQKRIKLTLGQPYLDVIYNTFGERAYVKSAFTPDLVDLTWNATMDRIWDPDGLSNNGGYFGYKNPRTNATGAVVVGGVNGVGGAGAVHNLDYSLTLLKGDELYGDGAFELYVYGGYTSAPNGQGHIPELLALRNQLVDQIGPDPVRASYYPTPNRLSIRFNQVTKYDNVVRTKIKFDDDNDGVADVTLSAADIVSSIANGVTIDLQLSGGAAAAIEALNTASIELMLDAGAVTDPLNNPNLLVTHLDNKPVTFEAATKIAIDGRIDPVEWVPDSRIVDDPDNDSQWGSANELDAMHLCWDASYLYVGIDGQVSGNSWIVYIDTDWNGPNGAANLTAINSWERGALFTGAGFKPDLQWGTYQHQGAFDSSSLFKITSATTSNDLSSLAVFGRDSNHIYGLQSGTEIAIPWDAIYGLGPNQCPPGTQLAFVASICYDPDPTGELGGDVMPNNPSGTNLPTVGSYYKLHVDLDGNGVPDPNVLPVGTPDVASPPIVSRPVIQRAWPNPFNPSTRIAYVVPPAGPPASGGDDLRPASNAPVSVRLSIFDVRGREVARLVEGEALPGRYEITWDGRSTEGDVLPSGVYFARLLASGVSAEPVKVTIAK